MTSVPWLALPLTLILAACASDAGEGTIDVRVYGESFIEEGIPAANMDDGWAIEFDRFDISLQDVVMGDIALEDPEALDLASSSAGEGHEVGIVTVPAGAYDEPAFTIARVEVEGSAEKDGTIKTFDWVFAAPTHYEHCETTIDVETDGEATFQITVHADHLFFDSLVSHEPQILFGAFANADADEDGEITEAELAAASIGAYDPGNEDIEDLWSWLIAEHRTLGHVDGEGHCQATAVE